MRSIGPQTESYCAGSDKRGDEPVTNPAQFRTETGPGQFT
jgi:hypothetical protein